MIMAPNRTVSLSTFQEISWTLSQVRIYKTARANPGSEFVVANTLANRWKKLEPNEIDFSQGF